MNGVCCSRPGPALARIRPGARRPTALPASGPPIVSRVLVLSISMETVEQTLSMSGRERRSSEPCCPPGRPLPRTRPGALRAYGIGCAGASNCVPAFGFFDGNGDGKADFIYHRVDANQFRVLLSTGSGFDTDTDWGDKDYGVACAGSGNCQPAFGYFDTNGDGKSDFVYNRDNSTELRAVVSNGADYNPDALWGTRGAGISCVGPPTCQPSFSYIDVTGDGKADFTYIQSDNSNLRVAPSGPGKFLLTSVTNGLGGATTIAYTYSPQYTNTQLPIPLATVSSLTTCDNWSGSVLCRHFLRHLLSVQRRVLSHRRTGSAGVQLRQGDRSDRPQRRTSHHGNLVPSRQRCRGGHQQSRTWPSATPRACPIASRSPMQPGISFRIRPRPMSPTATAPPPTLRRWRRSTPHSITAPSRPGRSMPPMTPTAIVLREDQSGDLSTTSDDRTVVRTFGEQYDRLAAGLSDQ
jgi:hypothetical protein